MSEMVYRSADRRIVVYDRGDHFYVIFDGMDQSNWPKKPNGFQTARELGEWLAH